MKSVGDYNRGVIQHVWVDGTGYEHVDQIRDEVVKLVKDKESLAKELSEIKNRRQWEELTMVTDERTGLAAVVHTWYRWEPVHMRVDLQPRAMGLI